MTRRARRRGAPRKQHDEWTPALAEALARHLGVFLTPQHWRVVACARELTAMSSGTLHLATLAKRVGISEQQITRLFPPDTGTLGIIAGVPY